MKEQYNQLKEGFEKKVKELPYTRKCLIDNISHIKIYDKCILCDKKCP